MHENLKATDLISLIGIISTLGVSIATLLYSIRSHKRAVFVNTVTTSRLKWIDSLRDKVAEFIAVTASISNQQSVGDTLLGTLLLQRDTLLHQIVLHLNPLDPEDQEIRMMADSARDLTHPNAPSPELSSALLKLRDAGANYLKKEWNRVKTESEGRS